jgi:hypothetical protein
MRVTDIALLSLVPLLPTLNAQANEGVSPQNIDALADSDRPVDQALQPQIGLDVTQAAQRSQPSQPEFYAQAIEFAPQASAPLEIATAQPLPEFSPPDVAEADKPTPELVAIAPTAQPEAIAPHRDEPVTVAAAQPSNPAPATIALADYQADQGAIAATGAAALQTQAAEPLTVAARSTPIRPELEPESQFQLETAAMELDAIDTAALPKQCEGAIEARASETASPTMLLAQAGRVNCYDPQPLEAVEVPESKKFVSSPAMSIYIPVGYGADNNTVFLNANYQSAVRPDASGSLFNGGLGIGLGDASEAVGLELSYVFANNDDFGEGGFNAKVHRRIADDLSVAAGWNGFLNIGRNDFEQSLYGVATKVFRLTDSLDDPFSRLAVTAGVGNNQYRSNGAAFVGENSVNVFGNMALRVARPVSFIAEWTGQDLGLGLSIAPFKNLPITITPAVRDIVTTNDGRAARFVIGLGTAFRF